MASDQNFVDFITDQIRGAGEIVAKKIYFCLHKKRTKKMSAYEYICSQADSF